MTLSAPLSAGPAGAVLLGTGSACQDAVYYEATPSAPSFMGCAFEASARGIAGSPYSLSRIPSGADSGENPIDFRRSPPSPGAANERR